MPRITKVATWVRCPCCENYWCRKHGKHAHECNCPLIERWRVSPYQAGMQPVERLSHRERQVTPIPFARYLLARLQAMFPTSEHFAILWTDPKTPWWKLWPQVEIWGKGRDANTYQGPWPVVAHPPCGPWGSYRSKCFHSQADGINAMRFVHQYGGIVEQPASSRLFDEHGQPGGWTERVNQGEYGHRSLKPTILYFFCHP